MPNCLICGKPIKSHKYCLPLPGERISACYREVKRRDRIEYRKRGGYAKKEKVAKEPTKKGLLTDSEQRRINDACAKSDTELMALPLAVGARMMRMKSITWLAEVV